MLSAIGTGMFNLAVSAVAVSSAPVTMSGLAAGVYDTSRHTGIAVGIAALGALLPSGAVARHSASFVDACTTCCWPGPSWPSSGRSRHSG
jgi:hypothetical protein